MEKKRRNDLREYSNSRAAIIVNISPARIVVVLQMTCRVPLYSLYTKESHYIILIVSISSAIISFLITKENAVMCLMPCFCIIIIEVRLGSFRIQIKDLKVFKFIHDQTKAEKKAY